jgi:hypothetical protein
VKILVDSCVWSLALRRKKSAAAMKPEETRLVSVLVEGIRDGRVVLVGPVRQEILSGVKHTEQFDKLRESLEPFPDAPIASSDYVHAARLDNLCRANGVKCGEVDMLLCAVAEGNGWTILTNDSGLIRCIEVIERDITGREPARRGRLLLEVI